MTTESLCIKYTFSLWWIHCKDLYALKNNDENIKKIKMIMKNHSFFYGSTS